MIYKAKYIDNLSQTNFQKMISKIFILLFLISGIATAQEQLIMVGGGKRTPDMLTKFIELSGNEKGKILVIPWASGEQEIAESNIKNEVAALSKISVDNAPFAPLTAETKAILLAQLKTAKGIFFCGGDQNGRGNLLLSVYLTCQSRTTKLHGACERRSR